MRPALASEISDSESARLLAAVTTTIAAARRGIVAAADGMRPSGCHARPSLRKVIRLPIRAGSAIAVIASAAKSSTASTKVPRWPAP